MIKHNWFIHPEIGWACSNCLNSPPCDRYGEKVMSKFCPYCGTRMYED